MSEAKKCYLNFKILGFGTIINHQKISIQDVMDADIIVVSYQFLQNANYKKYLTGVSGIMDQSEEYINKPGTVILNKIHFYRLILDEVHELDKAKIEFQDQVASLKTIMFGVLLALQI